MVVVQCTESQIEVIVLLSIVHSVNENVQHSYMFHVLAILCAGLSQKV